MDQTIHIVEAYIYGLDNSIHYDEAKKCYFWELSFVGAIDAHSPSTRFYLNEDYNHAKETQKNFKKSFTKALVKEGDPIHIAYNDSGIVLAISNYHSILWIDLKDDFKLKLLNEIFLGLKTIYLH